MSSLSVARLVPGVRTVIKRRGLGYLSSVVRDHVPPRVAYRLLRSPDHRGAAVTLVRRAWTAFDDLASTAAPAEVARALERVERQSPLVMARGAVSPPVSAADLANGRARDLDRLLNAVHRLGITGLRHSLDRLVLGADGRLAFADVRRLRIGAPRGVAFLTSRDLDREAVNARFGLTLLTEARVRQAQEALRQRLPAGWFREYAPIDFGAGVSMGMFVSTDSGTGRWDFLNGPVVGPLVRGRRVLDLGSNNGSLPLMMARAGAREVIGVEQSPLLAEAARLNHSIFEWRDMREYQFEVRVGDMREFLTSDWGTFDVVTAFCSIYYLPPEDQAAIVARAAAQGATCVLQANEGARDIPGARTSALRDLLRANGYSTVTIHTRDGFPRPLVVGRSARHEADSGA